MKTFLIAFLQFASFYRPDMPLEEKQLLPVGIYEGCEQDQKNAFTFTAICQLESKLKVRHWYPDVRPNMDAAGTHNNVLCLELYREKLITDSKDWRKSKQWPIWRKLFQERPDVGTMFAARAFTRLADRFGLENAVQMWKSGHVGTVPGIQYAMQVTALRQEMLKMCRQ